MSDDVTHDPAGEQVVARIRRLMTISLSFTFVAIAIVIGIIGYRVFRNEGSAAAPDVTAMLPKGARVVQTAVSEDRIVVTVDVAGALEVRLFDARTLRPAGRLGFAIAP